VFVPGQNPLGRRISIGRSESRRDLVIVGVVGNSKYQRLTEPSRSIAFLPSAQVQDLIEGDELFVEVRAASDDGSIAETLRRQIRSLDQRVPLRIETVADRIRVSLVKERVITTIAAFLGFAALILACAGVYGLLAYIVSRQTSEIGLRLALGASRRQMLWMVIRQSLLLGGAGILLGVTASLGLGRFARNLLYQVSETDVLALAVAAVIMFVVAMAAGFFPARRAANVDPLIALRTE
jgi:ABC-type lipoprotein release transport system permease subunit